jgi:hypothetical protein
MIIAPRITFVVSIAVILCLATANAVTVAVLELITVNDEMDLSVDETKFLTDELRRQATVSLPKEYSVLTREKIIDLASKATGNLNTVVEIGIAVKSDYVTQGFIGKFSNMFTLTIELYETSSGKLLGYFVKETSDLKGLLDAIRENSPSLFVKTTQAPSEPQPSEVLANKPAEPQLPTPIAVNIPAEPQQPTSGVLGWRGITRISVFSATAVFGAVAIYKHYESKDNLKKLNNLKTPYYSKDGYKEWKSEYNAKADELIGNEKQRNIFGSLAGVCALSGIVTFFF